MKLTKNELRNQQTLEQQLSKYLPTLQLKKGMLQLEVHEAKAKIKKEQEVLEQAIEAFSEKVQLLSISAGVSIEGALLVQELKKRKENIAGLEVPELEEVVFSLFSYSLFDTPPWLDSVVAELRALYVQKQKIAVQGEKLLLLEKELREVSIRVNLFEKILIPRCKENIRKIKVFLGDQLLAAVSQAKVAKAKLKV